jgi:hypothetical protein
MTQVSEFIGMIFFLWGLFLLPALPVCGAIWLLGRKRVRWNLFDFLVLVLPYAVWLALLCTDLRSKSMSNIGEAFFVGMAVPFAPIIRLLLPKRWNGRVVTASLLILACAVGAVIYFSVPCLPE